jgi:hypothetical protein
MTDALITFPTATAASHPDLARVAQALANTGVRYSRIEQCQLLIELGRHWETQHRTAAITQLEQLMRVDHPALRFRRSHE